MTVSNNQAAWAAGVYLYEMSLSDSTITGNEAREDAGGVYSVGTNLMENVTITDNTAAGTGGGVYLAGGDLLLTTCEVSGNTATAGGGAHVVSGTSLESDSSDWGDSTDGDDNSPDDVYVDDVATAYASYGSGESFVCDSTGCF